MKKLKFDWPGKFELALVGMLIFTLFWLDVLQNKLFDLGLNHNVTFFGGLVMPAIQLFWMVVALYIIILLTLVMRNLWMKNSLHLFDYIVGVVVVYSLVIIVAGISGGLALGSNPIPWLFNLRQIDIHHIALVFQIAGAFYFLLTK